MESSDCIGDVMTPPYRYVMWTEMRTGRTLHDYYRNSKEKVSDFRHFAP